MIETAQESLPVAEFAKDPEKVLEEVRQSHRPITLTAEGKADVVVQDAAEYEKLLARLDRMDAIQGIQRGLEDVAAGRVRPVEEFFAEFRAKHGIPDRPDTER